MIELVDEDVDSRTVQYLLQAPVNDGGQFDMIINIIEKYGVVPKAVYPDTYSCTSSGHMNWMITCKLREYSATLRCLYKAGKSKEELKSAKKEMVSEVYRILAILLGEPPKVFDFSFRDKNGKFYKFENLTPLSFYKDHVGYDVSSMVSLVHDPRHPMFSKMTVKYLKNVEEGKDVTYVNVPIHYLKGLAIEQLLKNEPVWFGCDVNKFFHNDIGVMDLKAFRYDLAFGMGFNMTKAERLQYGESQMTHAMVFTGVDLNNKGKPTRWRVENSWGVTSGEKGFESMTDAWFEEYTFQVVVPRSMLPKEVEDVLTKPAIELPPWDPM
ncbi:hypothetical protein HK098_000305 [Nowakowskiella sp. JEL0407]|nr:hypothetical protein HK098_000298 [Nowakowskiella sp. JEL0407]KAJ3125417.1 hypothetical protein HK098_000305 [Nowakowskiella sp. JEL0407]